MLTERQIGVLRDLNAASLFNDGKRKELLDLITRGFVEKDGDVFKLTAMGLKQLLERRSRT